MDLLWMLATILVIVLIIGTVLEFFGGKIGQNFPVHLEEKWFKGNLTQKTFEEFGETKENEVYQKLLDELLVPYLVGDWYSDIPLLTINADEPNAFAFPGGTIGVTTQLIKQSSSLNEIAFVLCHEIGHLKYRHNMNALFSSLGWSAVLLVTGAEVSGLVSLGQLSNSREHELEADQFALECMQRKFGHVNGYSHFFEKVKAEGLGKLVPSYLSTHPASDDRIVSLAEFAQRSGLKTEGELLPVPSFE